MYIFVKVVLGVLLWTGSEGCWTEWFDRDDPSGTGDWEKLDDLHDENPGQICDRPLQIEVQTTSGDSVASTGDVITVSDPSTGFLCENFAQSGSTCQDYMVRFFCPEDFCNPKGSGVIQRFVQTGSDVTLDIIDPVALKDYYLLYWRLNGRNILSARNGVAKINSKKVIVFHPENSSVTLKNLQKEDSGLYEAQIVKEDGQQVTYNYSVSVWDPVSPVTVTVDSVSNSSESCNFTVSCSTEDFHLKHSFTCYKQTCDGQEAYKTITPSGAHLHLHLSNVAVSCNHSNHVGWTKDTIDLRTICPHIGPESVLSVCVLKSAVFSVGLIFMVSAVITVHILEWRHKRHM